MRAAAIRRPGVTVRVPAKINLELFVGPRRPDGYHDLSTVFHAVSIWDDVTISRADTWSVAVTGPYAGLVPLDDDNLAVRAAQLLAGEVGIQEALHIEIVKDIPVAAGLAGGSADAAACLVACDTLWELGGDRGVIDEIAAAVGSDVNFALAGGTAIGAGRGERVAPVLGRGRYHWVFATSEEGLRTADVFAECDRLRGDRHIEPPRPSPEMMAALRSGDAVALGQAMHNDLQPAAIALRPELADVLDAGLEYGALGGVVSGSGPTVAFLVGGQEGALDLAVALTASGVVRGVKRATGPAHGAHVVAAPGVMGS